MSGFKLNGSKYDIEYTNTNPLSNTKPTSGNWYYFLHYYSNTNGQPDILTCTSFGGFTNQPVYVCAFAQGGSGGGNYPQQDGKKQPYGGGGGGGQCVNKEMVLPVTVTLYPIGQNTKCTFQNDELGVSTLKPGANGSITTPTTGGSGGNGGGAGGNGGSKGSVSGATDGAGGKPGSNSGNGFTAYNGTNFIASNGNGFGGDDTKNAFNFVSTKQIFADGTSANLASGGIAGYYNTSENKYYDGQSGNISGVMFYFKHP